MNTELSREQKIFYQESLQAIQATIKEIGKVTDVLTNKRRTLAEKAIQEELHQCTELNSCLADHLSEALRRNQFCLANHTCANLQQININLNKQLIAFMKAADYNLNYLEQYFEHDFWLQLTRENYAKRLTEVKEQLQNYDAL